MMQRLSLLMVREWKRFFSIPVFYVVNLIIPPLLFLFYGFIYQHKFAENIPVAIWDDDHSEVSRKLTDMMEATRSIHFTEMVKNQDELDRLIKENKVFGAVHIPANLEANAKNNKQSTITVFTYAGSLVAAKMIYKDAAGVIIKGGLSAVLQKNIRQGMAEGQAEALIQPIKLNIFTLHNPEYNYQEYLTPGLISVAIQMAIIMAAVLLLSWEFRTNTFAELMSLSKGSALLIILAKMMALLSISWINFLLINFIIFPLYDLDKSGTIFQFFLLYNGLVLACISFGLLVSAIFEDTVLCTDIALFFTSPAFVFSGFTFPRSAMPWYDQFYASLMPYTYFLDGFVKGYFMQLPLEYFKKELIFLLFLASVFFSLSVFIYQIKINKKKTAHA